MTDQRTSVLGNVRKGMNVLGSDGEKLGEVDGVEANSIVVKKGFFFPQDYYIPADAVANTDGDNVYLSVSKDAALDQRWDTPPVGVGVTGYEMNEASMSSPSGGERQAGSAITTNADRVSGYTRTEAGMTSGGHQDHAQPFDHDVEGNLHDEDRDHAVDVPLAQEELTARTQPVERGTVRVDKDVVKEEQTLEVPVTEERVNVQRRAVDRDATVSDADFGEGSIDIPVRGEDVEVGRETRVTEEVEISKEPVQRTERVSGTVRREEVHVDDDTARQTENMPDNWQNR
jgi:uncharacterized protein (TIGR02271 family)